MKFFYYLLLLTLFQTFVFAQTKIDEYALTDSDSESARIYNFSLELNKQIESKGLIIIYAGENLTRAGNLFSFVNGVKRQIGYYSKNKVSVVVAEGKKPFFKELWIIPKGENQPEFKLFKFDFSTLKTKLFYAFDCLDCLPAVPELYHGFADLENYAEILKENSSYQGVIEIFTGDNTDRSSPRRIVDEARRYAGEYRKTLTKDYKIPNNRITIKIMRSPNKDSITTANLYIVPLKKN